MYTHLSKTTSIKSLAGWCLLWKDGAALAGHLKLDSVIFQVSSLACNTDVSLAGITSSPLTYEAIQLLAMPTTIRVTPKQECCHFPKSLNASTGRAFLC